MASHHPEGANNKRKCQRLIHHSTELGQDPQFSKRSRSDLITSVEPCHRFSFNTKKAKLPR
jgi:hypothetical protein